MKLDGDELAGRLERLLGAGTIHGDATTISRHSIDGRAPGLVCVPADAAELADALRVCAEAGAAVVPWGGGTAIDLGNPPRRIDVVLSLARLNRLVEHDDANLTATLQAGMTLASAQETVSARRQFLPFDAPLPDRATVGGVIATNSNGVRRSSHGSVRDVVTGAKALLATGEPIKMGGKVVKNVAGYDLAKLFIGSLGTLGIITEATVRTAPLPEVARTTVACGTLRQLFELAEQLSQSALLPAAIVITSSALAGAEFGCGEFLLALRAEGFEENVARHVRASRSMAAGQGLTNLELGNGAHRRFWEDVRDSPSAANGWLVRAAVPSDSIATFVSTILGPSSGLDHPVILADCLSGTVWIRGGEPAVAPFHMVGRLARELKGHAILLRASLESKTNLDVWGDEPAGFSLMREIKRQFDPLGMLNPGRFVGGL